jgi:hypothetical protein
MTDPLSNPPMINEYAAEVQWYWKGRAELFGEKSAPFAHILPRMNPGLGWEAADQPACCDMAHGELVNMDKSFVKWTNDIRLNWALYLNKHQHTIKAYVEEVVWFQTFLTPALDKQCDPMHPRPVYTTEKSARC